MSGNLQTTLVLGGTPRSLVPYMDISDAEAPPKSSMWHKYVHINGGVYYYHPEKRIITEHNMEDERWRNALLAIHKEGMDMCNYNGVFKSGSVDNTTEVLLLCSGADDEPPILPSEDGLSEGESEESDEPELPAAVSFVCHKTLSEVHCLTDGADIRVETNSCLYWTRVEAYPMHLHRHAESILPHAQEAFLSAMMYLSNQDVQENKESFIVFTREQIDRFFEIYTDLLDAVSTNAAGVHILLWFLARVIREVKAKQEAYGQQFPSSKDGRLGYAVQRQPQLLIKLPLWRSVMIESAYWFLACLFFVSNEMFRKRLERTRWDKSARLPDFRRAVRGFLAEWADSTLLATVFVGANLTFLSIGNITSLQRTGSLVSTMFSILSIASGLYHTWHHRIKVNADIVEAVKYLYHVQGPRGRGAADVSDPVIMSFFLAVPIASLSWAVVWFGITIVAYCVQGASMWSSVPLLVSLTGVVSGFTFVSFKSIRRSRSW